MIVAVGVDLLEIARIERLWHRAGARFLTRVFTTGERDYCLGSGRPAASLTARFCAKEAVMKCLRTGWTGGVTFRSIEVVRDRRGGVALALHDQAAAFAAQAGVRRLHLSLSHNEHSAIAFVVAET